MLQCSTPNSEHVEHAPLHPDNQMLIISSAGPAPVRTVDGNCSPAASHLHGANLSEDQRCSMAPWLHGSTTKGAAAALMGRGSVDPSCWRVPREAAPAGASRSSRFSPRCRTGHPISSSPSHFFGNTRGRDPGSAAALRRGSRLRHPHQDPLSPPLASITTAHPWPRSTGNRQMLRKGKIPGKSTQSTRSIGQVRAGPRILGGAAGWIPQALLPRSPLPSIYPSLPASPLFLTFQLRTFGLRQGPLSGSHLYVMPTDGVLLL